MSDRNQVLDWKVFGNYNIGVSCCNVRISTSEITAETILLPFHLLADQTLHSIRRSLLDEYKLPLNTLTAFRCLDWKSSDGLLPYSNSDHYKPLHLCHTCGTY